MSNDSDQSFIAEALPAFISEAQEQIEMLEQLLLQLEDAPDNRELLVSDTVGFIRHLPHTLVEAFQATLEETVHADLLLHVVDASSPARAGEVVTQLIQSLEGLTLTPLQTTESASVVANHAEAPKSEPNAEKPVARERPTF